MKGEIWLANLPQWTGKEQLGKRPVLLMSKNVTNLVIVIPLTSNLNSEKYHYTLKVKPSDKNCLTKDSVALIFQIRAIDIKRTGLFPNCSLPVHWGKFASHISPFILFQMLFFPIKKVFFSCFFQIG